jgi:hypothetical protein
MPRILPALILSFCLALPITAHADTFQYTIINNINLSDHINFPFLPYIGTYTFTVSSVLTGNSFVYGPSFTDSPFPGFPYIFASDFTVPSGSPVDQINITDIPLSQQYAFTLYGAVAANGGAIGTSLLQDAHNPNLFTADYGPYGSASMEITDISGSQVPEPSTITLIGLGAIGIATQLRRRIAHP